MIWKISYSISGENSQAPGVLHQGHPGQDWPPWEGDGRACNGHDGD